MDFSLIWTILAGTNVVHISGIGCILRAVFYIKRDPFCNTYKILLINDKTRITYCWHHLKTSSATRLRLHDTALLGLVLPALSGAQHPAAWHHRISIREPRTGRWNWLSQCLRLEQ